MPVRAVESEHVQNRLTLGGVDDLADAEQRSSFGNLEQLGGLGVGGSCVYFFIGMRQLQAVFSLQQGKQRKFFQRRVADIGKILGGEIAGLQREGFIGSLAECCEAGKRPGTIRY